MAVPVVNLVLEKGTTFTATFNVFEPDARPATFNNFSAVCKIKKYPTSPISYNCQVEITAATGTIKVSMAKTTTTELESGRNYYDIIFTNNIDGTSFRVLEGSIIVSDSISV
jgi:hypothetical protein